MGLLHALDDMGHPPSVGRRASDATGSHAGVTPESNAEAPTRDASSDAGDDGSGKAGALNGVRQRVGGLLKRKPCDRGKPRRWSVWRVAAIAVLTYVAAVNLSYFFVLKPVWSQLDNLVVKKSVIQDFLVVRESASAVSGFRDALMRGDQRVTVVSELEELAEEAGLRFTGEAEFGATNELTKHMLEYPIEVELSGDYHEIGKFLALAEESPRALITKSVEVESDADNPSRQSVRVKFGVPSWED